ncbi:MAG: hypothetical protein AAFU85_33530 [Planctomycetota bacterium]
MSDVRDYKRIGQFNMPSAFVVAYESNTWIQPTDSDIARVIPFLDCELDFLDLESLYQNNCPKWYKPETALSQSEEQEMREMESAEHNHFRMYCSSWGLHSGPEDLPWLDIDQAIVFAVCRHHGDDVSIWMDYSSSKHDPRVVAPDFSLCGNDFHYGWRTVTETFSDFCRQLNLVPKSR